MINMAELREVKERAIIPLKEVEDLNQLVSALKEYGGLLSDSPNDDLQSRDVLLPDESIGITAKCSHLPGSKLLLEISVQDQEYQVLRYYPLPNGKQLCNFSIANP